MRYKSVKFLIVLAVSVNLLGVTNAHAYLDPGRAVFFCRDYWLLWLQLPWWSKSTGSECSVFLEAGNQR